MRATPPSRRRHGDLLPRDPMALRLRRQGSLETARLDPRAGRARRGGHCHEERFRLTANPFCQAPGQRRQSREACGADRLVGDDGDGNADQLAQYRRFRPPAASGRRVGQVDMGGRRAQSALAVFLGAGGVSGPGDLAVSTSEDVVRCRPIMTS